jgi:membrane protease YdiL (CAAX protease family)
VARVYAGTLLVYLLFQATALGLNSTFGEWGVLIALVVGAATVGVVIVLPADKTGDPMERVRGLGLGYPPVASIAVAFGIGALMLAYYPIAAAASGVALSLRDEWWIFVPGLFAQAGIAEELLFRGYLFGQFRQKRTFWRAALVAMPPFAIAHLVLFATMEPIVAGMALLLSIVIAIPLARLYDLGRSTIWAAAVLHCVVQAAPKLFVVPDDAMMPMSVGWMGVSLLAPWLVFAIERFVPKPTPAS